MKANDFDIFKSTTEAYYEEYKDISGLWKDIEAKANYSIAGLSILIGGVISSYGAIFKKSSTPFIDILVIIIIFFLFTSLLFAICVLFIRDYKKTLSGKAYSTMVMDQIESKDDQWEGFYNSVNANWELINESNKIQLNDKGRFLFISHCLFILGIVMFLILLCTVIFYGN